MDRGTGLIDLMGQPDSYMSEPTRYQGPSQGSGLVVVQVCRQGILHAHDRLGRRGSDQVLQTLSQFRVWLFQDLKELKELTSTPSSGLQELPWLILG